MARIVTEKPDTEARTARAGDAIGADVIPNENVLLLGEPINGPLRTMPFLARRAEREAVGGALEVRVPKAQGGFALPQAPQV